MFSGVDEFFNKFVYVIIVLSDVLCILVLKAKSLLLVFCLNFLESSLGVEAGELEDSFAAALEALEAETSF